MILSSGIFKKFDWWLAVAVCVLVCLGLTAIYSVALSQESADFLFVKKQGIALFLGVILFSAMTWSNYRQLRSFSLVLYIFGLLLLVGVLIFGNTIRGTTGWYSLFGFSFQPVELMKIIMVVVLGKYFADRARRQIGIKEILVSAILIALPVGLVLLQPDLGSALVLLSIWVVLLIFAGAKKRHLFTLLIGGAVVFVLAWSFMFADYQKARISTFLNPTADPLGQGYNVSQAVIAVGSGEWFGRGLGFGSQSQLKFLPESQTDFIFAVIAEELGFFGVLVVLGAFSILFIRIFRLIKYSGDDFTDALLVGIGTVIFFQFIVNIGMNLGLMPVTGIALPFLSYGGSSLLITMLMLGVVESVALRSSYTHSHLR
jgi:rod shape determining protein RodA